MKNKLCLGESRQQLSDGSEMGKLMKISEQVYAFEHYESLKFHRAGLPCTFGIYPWDPLRTWIGRRGTCETRAHFEIPKLEYKTEFLSMALITQHTQTYVIKTSSWLRNLLVSHLPPTAFGWPWAVHRLGGPAIFQLRSLGWQKDAKVVVDVFLKFILRGFCQ